MAEPFLGQIKIVGFNFAPRGYALCDGQILPINQNQSLYSLLGTVYGGDGRTSFGLPDLRGRTPVSPGDSGTGFAPMQGHKSGEENVTLIANQIPAHTHQVVATSNPATETNSSDAVLATGTSDVYAGSGNKVNLNSAAALPNGGGQSHNNMQPWIAVNFCIALQGLFPSRN